MKEESLIGRKIKGFEFESSDFLYYAPLMNQFIGKTGTIIEDRRRHKYVDVEFPGSSTIWTYPLKEVLKQLNEENKELSDQEIKELFAKIKKL